jgi:homoaconitase/3-isopropylmalate dehydratase large subunit
MTKPRVIKGDAEALRKAATELESTPPGPDTPVFVIPTDNEQYSLAIDNGAIATLHKAGATICAPGTPDPV